MTTLQRVRSRSRVERHLSTMFEDSVFSDLTLGFIHPAYPFTMRFNVHKSIMAQSPFFRDLIQNMDFLPTTEKGDKSKTNDSENVLTIHLANALSHRGFVLAPFQHIIRRKWQKSATSNRINSLTQNILSSHIRFGLRWMYAHDRHDMMTELEDEDTLRVLAMAVLFGLDDLATGCVERYIHRQLSMKTIMRDLEHICQLPRDHHAYLQLRDAALLLLLRYGADDPENLSELPVDYMADVLSADMLFVGCEFDRYCLIREVLSMFMRSVGQITWTRSGPVDQDLKRLSGFVRPAPVTASIVRSRKRKRIPSADLVPDRLLRLTRLSFSATVPFQSLVADASSGGVIDKATVLSHLLKTTVNYSNMTFDQLGKVRQDGIVDDDIVFRALWQREAFERLLIPSMRDGDSDEDRRAALDDYFDVDESNDHRRQLLLGTPKYRFCVAVPITQLGVEHGWTREEQGMEPERQSAEDAEDRQEIQELELLEQALSQQEDQDEHFDSQKVSELAVGTATAEKPMSEIWRQTFYSQPEGVWGTTYRVRIEAQVMPDSLLELDEDEDQEPKKVLLCKFELQRGPKNEEVRRRSRIPVAVKEGVVHPLEQHRRCSSPSQFSSDVAFKQPRIRYTVHCLNQREGLVEHRRVDPEDRMLVAVTDHTEGGTADADYVGQVRIDGYDPDTSITIDVVVCLQVPGFRETLAQ